MALSATAGDGALLPGPAADPSRIAVYVLGTGADERLLVCNTSKADRSYCIYTAYGKYWRYGMGVGNVQYAASLVTKNLVWWW